jgi:surface protein
LGALVLIFLSASFAGAVTSITNTNVATAVTSWIASPATATTTYGAIGAWDVSAVSSNANALFSATAAGRSATFNDNIASWNVASVTDMMSLFKDVTAFNQPVGAWNVARVACFRSTFNNASTFNQDIGSWNTAKATTLFNMFQNAAAFNQDISGWNTRSVSNMVVRNR